ncbi:MAG: hypothetical protein KJ066_19410 [Acidobacteria bacterium]|nr:hypothetical protein [Acidobacteriota bacterium]
MTPLLFVREAPQELAEDVDLDGDDQRHDDKEQHEAPGELEIRVAHDRQ